MIGDKAIQRLRNRGFSICRSVIPRHLLRPFALPHILSGTHKVHAGSQNAPEIKALTDHVYGFLAPLLPSKKNFTAATLTVYKPSSWENHRNRVFDGASIWHIDQESLCPTITIPLSRFSKATGATQIIDKSHRDGWEYVDTGLMDFILPKTPITKHNIKHAIMSVGDLLLVGNGTFHRRPGNASAITSKRECVFITVDQYYPYTDTISKVKPIS